MTKILTQTGDFTVKISFDNLPDELNLDFQPIVKWFNLTGSFVLLHWQARPKFQRGYGCYDSSSKKYYDTPHNKLDVKSDSCRLLQLNESIYTTLPTAVIYYKSARIVQFGERFEIQGIKS